VASRPEKVGEAIRWSKVAIAQTRIAERHYDRDEVRDLLVAAVIEELKHN
jgi:hypothetical protein